MSECPFCGEKIKNEQEGCQNCGYNYNASRGQEIYGEATEVESTVIEEPQYNQQKRVSDEALPLWLKIVLVCATLFIHWVVGLVAGCIFMSSKNPRYKAFGKALLIFVAVLFAVSLIMGFVGGFFLMTSML